VGERPLHEITAADLDAEFLPWWEAAFRVRNRRDPSPNSLRAIIQALRSFYGWMEKFDRLVDHEGKPYRNPTIALDPPVKSLGLSDAPETESQGLDRCNAALQDAAPSL